MVIGALLGEHLGTRQTARAELALNLVRDTPTDPRLFKYVIAPRIGPREDLPPDLLWNKAFTLAQEDNGSSLKNTPFPLLILDDSHVIDLCKLTTPNVLVVDIARTYAYACRLALDGNSSSAGISLDDFHIKLYCFARTNLTRRVLTVAETVPAPTPSPVGSPIACNDPEKQDYAALALHLAVYHLLHTRTLREALRDVFSRRGALGVNAATVAALMGAYYGMQVFEDKWVKLGEELLSKALNKN
jgi:hypothetical protein